MGKRADQAKKRKRQGGTASSAPHKAAKPESAAISLPTPPESASSAELLLPEELETAVFVLRTLAENPDLLSSKEMKDVKRETYALHRVLAEGAGATLGSSLTARITAALRDYRFTDALVLLFEMHARGIRPKLGALQRWVRECDATSAPDGSPGDAEALRCLDLILRIANMEDGAVVDGKHHSHALVAAGRSAVPRDHVRYARQWEARAPGAVPDEIPIWERMCSKTLYGAASTPPPNPYPGFSVVNFVKAAERRPPNLYDSTVWGSSPGAIRLTPAAQRRPASKVPVPGVPGAFVVLDVFTPAECLQIIQAAEAIGFERDQPAEGSATQKTSILARNFVWLADEQFLAHFYGQIKPFVPPAAPVFDGVGGGAVRGINARFRVYQYNQNQLYRPHIDGAWPAAGLHPKTGAYLHDSQPADDPLWSRYTLLVYLNSDVPADTGSTTFFLPSKEMGVMDATSVRPIQGAVLCFPHGDTQGSLLHEGSAVGPDGGKFVIRTDLLYEAKGFGQFKPPTADAAAQDAPTAD